jgi:hypothetical protein
MSASRRWIQQLLSVLIRSSNGYQMLLLWVTPLALRPLFRPQARRQKIPDAPPNPIPKPVVSCNDGCNLRSVSIHAGQDMGVIEPTLQPAYYFVHTGGNGAATGIYVGLSILLLFSCWTLNR